MPLRAEMLPFVPAYAIKPDSGFVPRLANISLIAMVCLSVTAPVITISGDLPWLKIEQLALPVILFSYAWFLFARIARPVRFNFMCVVGAVYALCITASIFYGWAYLGHAVIVRDLYEIPKALLPVLFFTLGLETEMSESWLKILLNCFSLAILFVCLYAWAQWANLSVSHILASYYSGGWHDEGSLAHYRRVYSTMGNPNLLGQLMTWSVAAFALAALHNVGSRLRNVLMALAAFVTLVMTGSRYGILNISLALGLVWSLMFLQGHRRKLATVSLLLSLPVLAIAGAAVAKYNPATVDRLQTLQNPLTTDSLRERLDSLWQDAGREFVQSPFLGHGPAKSIFSEVITDSEYLDVLKEFGAVGFFAYLGYYLYPIFVFWAYLRPNSRTPWSFHQISPAHSWVMLLSFVMLCTALVMNIGMSTFYNPSLQAFLWLWVGIGASATRNNARNLSVAR